MRRFWTFAILLAALPAVLGLPAPRPVSGVGVLVNADAARAIRGQFLVGLKEFVPRHEVATTAAQLTARHGGTVRFEFTAALRGFSLSATDAQAVRMAHDPAVAFVQRNQRAVQFDTQPTPASLWHLDRVDQRTATLDGKLNHGATSVPVYVLDDGVRTTHTEFEGRARSGFSAFGGQEDCGGHGTRVAALVAGKTYGVAKQSPVISVKVADCATATTDTVARGIEYIRENGSAPAVVNMSIGFTAADPVIDQAVKDAIRAGFTFVLAAGNGNRDACTVSPARIGGSVPGAIVVSATDNADARHGDANYGNCVSLFAPGVNIVSASKDGDTAAAPAATGTSYAAPLVSGLAASILTAHPNYTPAQVRDAILADATAGVVTDSGGPAASNRLVYLPPPDQPANSVPNNALNSMFNAYGNQGGHWTGGDETVSIPLPDGRVAWLFGDTMLGTVNPDGSRPPGQPMVHNSMVVQQGGTITQTLVGGTAAAPKSLVGWETDSNPGDLGWWPGEGRVVGNELQVFYTHVGDGGGGALSYVTLGRGIARFSLPGLVLQSLTPISLSTNARIYWGSAMVDGQDGYTYIYGIERVENTNHLYIARVAGNAAGGLNAPWQFWTGASDGASQWSAADTEAKPVMTGVGAGFSVKYLNGRFVLVTMDLSQPFTNRVLAFFAGKPTGPFRHPTLLYNAPETATPDAWVYNARLHPEQSGSGFVVSYNVGSFDPQAMIEDVNLYRPKFINVTLPPAVDASALPATPKALSVTSPSPGLVRLAWTPPPGSGLQYWIYERDVSSGATQFMRAQSAVAGSPVTIGVLNPGEYEYRIAAQNATGEGPPSTTATVTVTVPPPASAPTGLTAAQEPDGGIRLRWNAVTAAGWVSYRVYQRNITAGESTFTVSRSAAMDGTSALVGGLVHGNTYAFQVLAFNGGGDGPASSPVQIAARVTPPPAPAALTAAPNEDGTIALAWNTSGPGIWYWVYYRDVTAGESFTRAQYPVSTGTTFTAGYLVNGHTYAFYVTAIGQQGVESAPSNTVQAVAAVAPPPGPTNLTATPNEDGTIALAWNTSGPGVWYWMYYRDVTAGESFTRAQYPVSTGTTFTAGYLVNGHTYAFYVRAIGSDGAESAPSNTVQARALLAPPPAPTHLTATAKGNGDIELSWVASGPEYWYWVYYRDVTAGGSFTRAQYPVSTGTKFTAGYLTVGHTYAFYVTTIGAAADSESAPSNTVQAVSYVPPPAAPGNLTATAGNARVSLSWNSSGAGIWYWVYTRDVTAGGSFSRSQYPVSSGTTFTATMLTNGHTYAFYVTAIGEGGTESAPSNTVQARPQVPLPPAPANLTATPRNDGTIALSWTGSGAGIWYWVYSRNVSSGAPFVRQKYPVSTGTTFTAGYLNIGDTYEFYVTAFNDAGETARTNIARAKSTIPPPPAPGSLVAYPLDDGSVRLHWSSSGAGIWYWVYTRDASAGGDFTRLKHPVTSGTEFHSTWLKLGHRYEYYVTAFNAGGESARSNIASAVSAVAPPLAPQNLRAVPSTTSRKIELRWSSVQHATGYEVLGRSCGSTSWPGTGALLGGSVTSMDWHYGGCWEFKVIANRWGVEGPASGSATAYLPSPNDYPYADSVPIPIRLDAWGFVRRQCTSFAAWRIRLHHVSGFTNRWRVDWPYIWTDANVWDTRATTAGVYVSNVPFPGSILQSDSGNYGHVAFVAGIDGNDAIIEEYNGAVDNGYSIRRITWAGSSLQFLHFQLE